MNTPPSIIINGGGMVGMAMAIAVANLGVRVTVLERTPLPAQLEAQFDGRVSALALGSVRLLKHIGAWEGMAPHAEPILDIRVSDGNAPFFVHYDHREVGDEPFGYILENRYIRYALHEAARAQPHITLLDDVQIEAFRAGKKQAEVVLCDGRRLSAALVLAADGKYSALRESAGIRVDRHDYKQTAIVATIAHERPHRGLAQERFLPAGPFAVLPMTHNRSSLVWVEPRARAPLYLALSQEAFEQEITERVGGYLGKITLDGGRFSYPLGFVHAREYQAKRLALIGDAAHAIHPIAGQGVNLGFRDVAVLEDVLGKRLAAGGDIGAADVLAHYQRWRRFDNMSMLAVTDGLNHLFCSSLMPVKLARGLGLWAVNRVPSLKKLLMRHAMGLVGDIPASFRKAG